jgi:hypothetical protein
MCDSTCKCSCHLTAQEKQQIIADYARAHPLEGDRKVAAATGFNRKTVIRVRRPMQANGELPVLITEVAVAEAAAIEEDVDEDFARLCEQLTN